MSAESFVRNRALAQISGYATAASWMVSVWDWLLRFDDEVKFIWPMPRTAYVKWLYIYGEYSSLAMQSAVFATQAYLVENPTSLYYCRIYRGVEMAGVTLLMLCFDLVLLLRIYALYGVRTWSSAFATSAVLAEFTTTAVSAGMTIPTTIYDPACIMIQIPKSILVFVFGTFVSQAILLWLAYRKRERLVRPRASIVCVTIRDGILAFLSVSALLLVLLIFILHDSPVTTLMIFFVPMLVSVGTCRLILNLQRIPYWESTEHFTTEIWGLDRSADSFLLSDL